jgi:hypothetical protein
MRFPRLAPRSIAASLLLYSAIWVIVALVGTAFLLSGLYSRALDTSLSDTLDFHLETLVGRMLQAGDPTSDQIDLGDPRFDRPASGWYWAIRDPDGTIVNLSPSLVGLTPPRLRTRSPPSCSRNSTIPRHWILPISTWSGWRRAPPWSARRPTPRR